MKRFSFALLTLALSQVSSAGVVSSVVGALPAPLATGLSPITTPLNAALPTPLGDAMIPAMPTLPSGGLPTLPGMPSGVPTLPGMPSGLPTLPAAPTGLPLANTLTQLQNALTTGVGKIPSINPTALEQAGTTVVTTLTNVGTGAPSPQAELQKFLDTVDAQAASGVQIGADAFMTVIDVPSQQGNLLTNGSTSGNGYIGDGANVFAAQFNNYKSQVLAAIGGNSQGSMFQPLYDAEASAQTAALAGLTSGAAALAGGESTAFTTLVDGIFSAASNTPALPTLPTSGGIPSLPTPPAGGIPSLPTPPAGGIPSLPTPPAGGIPSLPSAPALPGPLGALPLPF